MRETAAAAGALGAYLTTVLPRVREELRRWRHLADAIPASERRRQALRSIDEKASNVEAVAVFATLAPRRRRAAALRAIVPLQVAIDYLDTLEEAGADGVTEGMEGLLVLGYELKPDTPRSPQRRSGAPSTPCSTSPSSRPRRPTRWRSAETLLEA